MNQCTKWFSRTLFSSNCLKHGPCGLARNSPVYSCVVRNVLYSLLFNFAAVGTIQKTICWANSNRSLLTAGLVLNIAANGLTVVPLSTAWSQYIYHMASCVRKHGCWLFSSHQFGCCSDLVYRSPGGIVWWLYSNMVLFSRNSF